LEGALKLEGITALLSDVKADGGAILTPMNDDRNEDDELMIRRMTILQLPIY
jgi:hypothetical protein